MLLVQDRTLSKPALDGHLRAHIHLSDPVGFCLQKTMTPQQVKKKRHVLPFTFFYPQPSTLATTYVQLTLYIWDTLWSLSQVTPEMQPSLVRHGVFLKCELIMPDPSSRASSRNTYWTESKFFTWIHWSWLASPWVPPPSPSPACSVCLCIAPRHSELTLSCR